MEEHAASFRAAHLAKCAQADAFAGEVLGRRRRRPRPPPLALTLFTLFTRVARLALMIPTQAPLELYASGGRD